MPPGLCLGSSSGEATTVSEARRFVLTYMINANRGPSGFSGIAGEPTNGMSQAQMETLRVPHSLVPQPGKTMAVVDGRKSPYTFLEANTHFVRKEADMNQRPHDDYNNWLFCDGHGETLLSLTTYGGNGTPTDYKCILSRTRGDDKMRGTLQTVSGGE